MASFVITNAGDATYNGVYNESGTYNTKPAYVLNPGGTERWLFYGGFGVPTPVPPDGYCWCLNDEKIDVSGGDGSGFAYYYAEGTEATPPEGAYTAGTGTPPNA